MIETKKIYGIYFAEDKEDPFDVIMRILEKNSLKENFEDMIKKSRGGGVSTIIFLYSSAKSIALGDLNEKDFILLAQKQLGISQATAESLNRDVKLSLLPLTVKVKLGEQKTQPTESDVLPKIKAPMEVEKILAEQQKKSLKEKIIESPKIDEAVSPAPRKKSPLPQKKVIEKPVTKQPRKSDTYREPIE